MFIDNLRIINKPIVTIYRQSYTYRASYTTREQELLLFLNVPKVVTIIYNVYYKSTIYRDVYNYNISYNLLVIKQ